MAGAVSGGVGGGIGYQFHGPVIAIAIYGVLAVVTLTSILNHLPGVFALRSPLGVVKSGYEYLWVPAIVASCAGLS